MQSPATLLAHWLQAQLPREHWEWLAEQRMRLAAGADLRSFNMAISLLPRRLGKADLILNEAALVAASAARPGWDPRGWSVDQAGRLLLLLEGAGSGQEFQARLKQLVITADVAELITFHRGLPLYPDPALHEPMAREGVRSSMRPVFEAVAHANPYPAENFSEHAWNQMVLKALFIGSTLERVKGLAQRCNADLARMLCDYARECRAAGRPVNPQLWGCIGPFVDGPVRAALTEALESRDAAEREAAACALGMSETRAATGTLGGGGI